MKSVERVGYIYLLRNLVNGKGYVGQSVTLPEKKRWPEHINEAFVKFNKHPLYKAIRKYGAEQFSAEIIHQCVETQLNLMETRFIAELNTFIDNKCGYNLTTGGGVCKASKRTRLRQSKGVRAAYVNDPTFRARLSEAQLRSYLENPERGAAQGLRMRAAHEVDPSKRVAIGLRMRGVRRSESTKSLLCELALAQWSCEEGRSKKILGLRRGSRNRWDRPEEKNQRSVSQISKWDDPAYRAMMLAAQRRRRRRERLAKNAKTAQAQTS